MYMYFENHFSKFLHPLTTRKFFQHSHAPSPNTNPHSLFSPTFVFYENFSLVFSLAFSLVSSLSPYTLHPTYRTSVHGVKICVCVYLKPFFQFPHPQTTPKFFLIPPPSTSSNLFIVRFSFFLRKFFNIFSFPTLIVPQAPSTPSLYTLHLKSPFKRVANSVAKTTLSPGKKEIAPKNGDFALKTPKERRQPLFSIFLS